MSHNLNFRDNKASFFTAKELAWHKLGTFVNEAQTSTEAIKLAQLDFLVTKKNLYTKEGVLVKDHFATVRDDINRPLGVVGKNYKVLQNYEAFDWFDSIVGSREAIFETAGALGNGETIFITAKLPKSIIVKQDVIDNYLLLTNCHSGKSSMQVMFTPIRVVCNNTLQAALSQNKYKVSIIHKGNLKDKLRIAERIMGISNRLRVEALDLYEQMYAKEIHSEREVIKYICNTILSSEELKSLIERNGTEYFKDKRLSGLNITKDNRRLISKTKLYTIENIMNYYNEGVGQKSIPHTMYRAYNAVTGYIQNVKPFSDVESKFSSMFGGSSESLALIAMKYALQPELIQ